MTAPCRYCPDRCAGCHAKCPAYLAYRADKDRENEINLMMQRATPQSRMADIIEKRKTKDRKRGRKS